MKTITPASVDWPEKLKALIPAQGYSVLDLCVRDTSIVLTIQKTKKKDKSNGSTSITLKHLPFGEHFLFLKVKKNRYKDKTTDNIEDLQYSIYAPTKWKLGITKFLAERIFEESIEYTFAEVAKRYDVQEETVRDIFKSEGEERVKTLNSNFEYIGIDKIYLKKNRKEAKTILGVITNLQNNSVIDIIILKKQGSHEILDLLRPNAQKIKAICFDDENANWDLIKALQDNGLNNNAPILDKFHVFSKWQRCMEAMIKERLKDIRKMKIPGLRNSLKKLGNNKDIIEPPGLSEELSEIFQTLINARNTGLYLKNFYQKWETEKFNDEEIKAELEDLCKRGEKYPKFKPFTDMLQKAIKSEAIFNYFNNKIIIDKTETKSKFVTNGSAESINNSIRESIQSGRGYSFDVLRIKCLLRNASKKAKRTA